MRKSLPSLSTRSEDLGPPELPVPRPTEPPGPSYAVQRRPADRIKEALLRWLEEEM